MKVFVSSLGLMGRRHLLGALRAEAQVLAFDPSEDSVAKAKQTIAEAGIENFDCEFVKTFPAKADFDAAVFSETANYREENFSQFIKANQSKRYLLEKPLSQSEQGTHKILQMAKELGSAVQVNFPRRAWPFYLNLLDKLKSEKFIEMTVNGGALGIGCNGIHYVDTFLFLTGFERKNAEVVYAAVDATPIGSGRGTQFRDYGGNFLVKRGNSSLFLSVNPISTSTPVISIKTEHGVLWIDENNYTFRHWQKTTGFDKPTYLYGRDYQISSEGKVEYLDLVNLTRDWLLKSRALPDIEATRQSHEVLFKMLSQGGAQAPYLFT